VIIDEPAAMRADSPAAPFEDLFESLDRPSVI